MSRISAASAKVKAFLESPSNRIGLILFGSSFAGAAVQYVGHDITLTVLATGAVSGIAAILAPDNAALKSDLPKLAAAGIEAAETKSPAAIVTALDDAVKVAQDIAAPTAA